MPPETHRYRVTAYRGDAPFAFVSYSHDDTALVFPQLETLVEAGVRLYYDEGIHPGHTWDDELAHAIERCAVFVFFVTRHSPASQNCRREIAFAVDHDKPIIAVHLEDVELPPGLRLSIGNRQAIVRAKFDEARYRERLVAAIREHVGGEPEREPADGEISAPPDERAPATRRSGRTWAAAGLALTLVVATVVGIAVWRHGESARAARDQQLDAIQLLIQQDRYGAAFTLAHRLMADASAREDARLQAAWKQIVSPAIPLTSESGATLWYRAYDSDERDWIVAGATPIEKPLDLPKGVIRIRLQKPGFTTGEFAIANPGPSVKFGPSLFDTATFSLPTTPLSLAPDGKLPADMVWVSATDEAMFLTGFPQTLAQIQNLFGYDRRALPPYAISKYEVTNREYKEFVDAGGYDNATYWDGLEFVDDGRVLDWPTARARFVDRTGRPGPAQWELSTYAQGAAELPVGGISWYEAVAYSRFRHLALPTIHHWTHAAFGPFEPAFPTAPNVAATSRLVSDGPIEARSDTGIGPWGTANMAGNVREWVWNFAGDRAIALGGSWASQRQEYLDLWTTHPMERSAQIGLRLMKSFEPVPDELLGSVPLAFDERVAKREPMSDEAFAAMRFQFTVGTRTPNDVQTTRITEADAWTIDEVALTFADGDALTLYVVLPRNRKGPLQPVLYGPGGGGIKMPNRAVLEQLNVADVVVTGGRALIIPIWPDSYQRALPTSADSAVLADQWTHAMVQTFEDGVRTIDYLATRDDIDAQRVGFLGISFGGIVVAPPLLAMEGRIRAAVLLSTGVWVWGAPVRVPSKDIVHYAPRIHLPVLMINGRYDSMLPLESSQARLFQLLGTAPEDKRDVLYDSGHFIWSHSLLAKDVNDWFDKYLGPVK